MRNSIIGYNRKFVAYVILVIGFITNSYAQTFFNVNWEKEYEGDLTQKVTSLIRSSDGNFVLTGETSVAGTQGSRILIIKLDSEGTIIWQKIVGSNGDFRLKSVIESKTEGFYILGTKQSESAKTLIWLAKIDNSGEIIWEATAGSGDNETMVDLAETSDNGVIICGNKEIKGDHDTDAWLIKFNKKGALESQSLFGSRYINDEFRSIISDNLNGYIISGYSSAKIGGDKIPYVVKVDFRGTKVWEKLYPSLPFTIPGAGIMNKDGSIVCLANTFSASGEFEKVTKLRLASNGDLIDDYSINRRLIIAKNSLISDGNGQLLMVSEAADVSSQTSDNYFIKLDETLNPVWIKPLDMNNVYYKSICQVNENSYVCSGWISAANNKLFVMAMGFQDYSVKLIDSFINQKLLASGGMKTGESQADFMNRVGRSVYEGLIARYSSDANNELRLLPVTGEGSSEVRNTGSVAPPSAGSNPQSSSTGNLPISGKYYALLIAVNEYNDPNITNLDKPVSDAEKLFDVLINDYLFEKINVTFLKNPTREQIISSLDKFEKELTNNDNFLLFYAGHGYWNETTQKGYWLPSDAKKQNTSNWIGNSTISDYIKSIKARHTLLISDACFGGSIFKTRAAFTNQELSTMRLYDLQSRKAMTSGNLTEVPDKSVFIEYLVKRLQENQEQYLSSEQLFFSFKPSVMNNTESVPEYGVVFNTGDDGGDFIFVKRKN